MATISLAQASTITQKPSRAANVKTPYLVEYVLDLAAAATAKGTTLAASDIIECIRIPAETVVSFAGFEVTVAATGGASDQALDLGDGSDDNRWVSAFDLDAAAAGDYAPIVIATANPTVFKSADTINIKINAATTVATAGKVRVFALMTDVSDRTNPGIAALAS